MNSSELKGFLTGLILGDGFISSGVTKRGVRIKSINEDFIEMLYVKLSRCTDFKLKVKYVGGVFRQCCYHRPYWELTILSHPYFAKKYHHFYDDEGHRKISGWAMNWLNDIGLANWYMSDGYVCLVGKTKGQIRDRRMDICTDRYRLSDIERLQCMMLEKFDVNTSIIKRGNRYRLRIKRDSYERFINIIRPYVVESMLYKLYLGYEQQPIWMSDEMWNYQEWLRSTTILPDNAEEHDIV